MVFKRFLSQISDHLNFIDIDFHCASWKKRWRLTSDRSHKRLNLGGEKSLPARPSVIGKRKSFFLGNFAQVRQIRFCLFCSSCSSARNLFQGEQAAAVARKQHQNTGIAADITAAATAMSQTYKVASYDDAPAFTAKPLVDMHKRQKAASGVPGGDDDDEDTTPAPKRKGDPHKSFSSKEKRKREMGQASREKSFVEEEKRMLKESTSRKAGYGFD